MEVKEFYKLIKSEFIANEIDVSDANALFDYFFGRDYITNCNLVNSATAKKIKQIAKRRISTREPIYSLIGYAPFYGRFFKTHKKVLKPRLDTEIALSEALKIVKSNSRVLDLCTGSGILGITINLETGANVVCSDISNNAIKLTKQNAIMLGANINVVKSDMFKNIDGKFDVIISNPPYIKSDDIKTLDFEVKNFDPLLALDGGRDGLYFYKIIADNFKNFLNPNGTLILEIGYDQAEDLKQLFKDYNVKVIKDFNNLNRVIIVNIM